ncbi:hypothetical protein [Paenibacillus endoradicis]|uniref:hypothetical protein n=1 Tax=Paenibacillus endoradicis TaxID=2972487 RepID=UPI0021598197|nr:hypothetical protein [Paenibacillus endoradicis]MCR8656725.1 hypothetical protein [Paenibacillus endoradicis]
MSRENLKFDRSKQVTISCGCRRNRIGFLGCCGGLRFNNDRRDRNCFCNRRRNENVRRHNRRRINSCC